MTTTTTTKKLSEMTPAELESHFGGISAAIRGLDKLGWERGAIAKALNKRYQHVRNVLITPVKNPKVTPVKEMSAELKKEIEAGNEYGPEQKPEAPKKK